jgi:plastocyanin
MLVDIGDRSPRLRSAALGAAAVIGVAACSTSSSTAARTAPQDTSARAMANMAGIAHSTPGTVTSAPRTAQKGDAQVRIANFTFSPATVTIRAGQTVEWANRDVVAHTVDLSGVISNVLNRGDTYTQRFTAPGTYPYICSIHPFMHGTVVVTT